MGNPWVEEYEREKAKFDRQMFFTFSPKKRRALVKTFCNRFGIANDEGVIPSDGEIAQDIRMSNDYKKFASSGALKRINDLENIPYIGDN